jgi:DNA-binding transcriptional ArsR family regulator
MVLMVTISDSAPQAADALELAALRSAADQACTLMKVLANPDRLLIVCQLVRGPQCVSQLERTLEIGQPTLSQQLTVLRAARLVKTQRRGKFIEYTLSSSQARAVLETLYSQFCGPGRAAESIKKEPRHDD